MGTRKRGANAPVATTSVRRRKIVRARSAPPGGRFPIYSFTLADGDEAELVQDREHAGAMHVMVSTRHDGVSTRPVIERVPVELLGREMLSQYGQIRELGGYRPPHADLSGTPRLVKGLTFEIGEDEDEPAHVFPPDSRYVYRDTAFPWRTVGRVWGAGGAGTGCTIGPRLVLTASHMIDWLDGGGAGWVKFSPAYYDGNGPWGEYSATRVISWNKAEGGLSDLETAFDYVVLVMNDRVGDHVGYPGYRTYDDDWNGGTFWQHMGYPGDLTGTERPAFVGDASVASTSSESTAGQDGLVLGHFNDITPGHSGGPAWGWWADEPWPRVVGVQSAQASTPGPSTSGDNEFGGGSALSALISYARSNYP
jgi:V8-like Glu-specific endopeptidase